MPTLRMLDHGRAGAALGAFPRKRFTQPSTIIAAPF